MLEKAMMLIFMLALTGCSPEYISEAAANETVVSEAVSSNADTQKLVFESSYDVQETGGFVTEGTETYRDFIVDSVLHSEELGDIHYCVKIPDSYDGSTPYSLYITLPGYEGLYFQGAGINIRSEEFAFEAQKYKENMIIVAPQLDDWGELSADKTIALTEFFLRNYNIDREQVYINGYSGGGETLSLVLDKRPELYTRALMCSSQWDGDYDAVTEAKTPVYFVIGESDEYYGSEPFKEAYEAIYNRYKAEGISEEEIQKLVVLDIKPASYFEDRGVTNQHGGGGLFSRDETVMGWLFGTEHSEQAEN